MVSIATRDEVFQELKSNPDNNFCFDCDAAQPQWAAVLYGTFVCASCAAEHQALGPRISRVKNLEDEGWTATELKTMRDGGNKQLEDFFALYKIKKQAPVDFKYKTKAAEFFRTRNQKAADIESPQTDPPELLLGLTLMDEEDVHAVQALEVDEQKQEEGVWKAVEGKVADIYQSTNEVSKRPVIRRVEDKVLSWLFTFDEKVNRLLSSTPPPANPPANPPGNPPQ